MTIGASIFLMAVGAILRFAVSDAIDGVDLAAIGVILMIAGAVGLVIGLFLYFNDRDRVERGRYVEVDGPPPPPAARY